MITDPNQLSAIINQAVKQKDWPTLERLAERLLAADANSIDGYYIRGVAHRAQRRTPDAISDYKKAIELDPSRYDIATELANLYSISRRNGDAAAILNEYEEAINDSPRFLGMAGTVYTEIGLAHKAWPLFERANILQPNVDVFEANLATCAVFLGKVEQAKALYKGLLSKVPDHRKNHYQLSRLGKAEDFEHINQMKAILADSKEEINRDVPLYFAIAKELEDLEQWDECFDYYRQACDAILGITNHDVSTDIAVINAVIDIFDANWLAQKNQAETGDSEKTPIFIVGLPRTGTTLLERILSSHSNVSSLGETLFLQMSIRELSGDGLSNRPNIDEEVLRHVASSDVSKIREHYLRLVDYRLGDEPLFIEKLPLNFLYVGLIAKAWPNAKIIHMLRNPLDACFSMYKQVFTWAYKYSYSTEQLGEYYVAYDRLRKHWNSVLGGRVIEVSYEDLVHDQEAETKSLLNSLGLNFEDSCLHFEKNTAPSTTASSVQVRAKVHSGSIGKWQRFESQLTPLKKHLEENGVDVGSALK